MTGIRVFVLLALTLSGCLCDASTAGKDTKRAVKSIDYASKNVEKKSTNEKRESSGLTAVYGLKTKDEPFRPLYQYQYQPTPVGHSAGNYVTAATTPKVTYSKPDYVIRAADSGEGGGNPSPNNNEVVQYGSTSAYKSEGGILYAPGNYKATGNSGGGVVQYASNAYRGPYVANYQPAAVGIMKMHNAPLYAPPPPGGQPPAAAALPLHYGGFEQQLPPQHHQQNQYAIAFPAEYLRHYQQNIPAPFPLHGAHATPFVFAVPPPQSLASLKDQSFKQNAVHYILAQPPPPPSPQAGPAASSPAAPGPTVVTHFIPFYGAGSQQHQQFQQHSPRALYFGGHHLQAPATSFGYTALPPQQQPIQFIPKSQYIQMAAIGAGAAAATVPYIPLKPILAGQQLQQPLHHFHQHHHPGATSYSRYSQGLSDGNSIISGGGGSSPAEVPSSETSSSSSTTLKLNPLYSSPSSQSSGAGGGKMSYTYASDAHSVGPVYTHPGAIQYGTHLYQAPSKVIEIGSNRVTAGSAAIAGVTPPAYHPQQKSAATASSHSRSVGGAAGGGGSSSPVVKYS